MSCELIFLAVGNADSIIINPENSPCVLVDLPNPARVINWLTNSLKKDVDCLYITHTHRDHFVGLAKFVTFYKELINKKGNLNKLVLPSTTVSSYLNDLEKFRSSDEPKYHRIQSTLDQLDLLNNGGLDIVEEGRNSRASYENKLLTIHIIHPRVLFNAQHTKKAPKKLNDRVLILKVEYGEFSAILLADLEGDGLEDILDFYKGKEEKLKAKVVKLSHHGAYPNPKDKYKLLLELIDAELAILSVGSTNQYGHVKPALFNLLNSFLSNKKLSFEKYMCTEATRTCMHSNSKSKTLGRKGLEKKYPCAGDITLQIDNIGNWTSNTSTNHRNNIKSLKYAFCK